MVSTKHLIYLIEDAVKNDYCEEENKLLQQNVEVTTKLVKNQEQILDIKEQKINNAELQIDQCVDMLNDEKARTKSAEKKASRHKVGARVWRTLTIVAVLGIIGNHLHWKYVK